MEQLREISESPWLPESRLDVHHSVSLSEKKINTSVQLRNTRPLTQQTKRNKNYIFFTHNREPVYQNLLTSPSVDMANHVNFSKALTPFFEERPQSKDQVVYIRRNCYRQNKNYTDLRKTYEKDFFIGAKSMKIDKTQELWNSKSPTRKGRLWLGRPILVASRKAADSK